MGSMLSGRCWDWTKRARSGWGVSEQNEEPRHAFIRKGVVHVSLLYHSHAFFRYAQTTYVIDGVDRGTGTA
jgi:hypothetical protein